MKPSKLNVDPNIERPDDFYEALVDMYRDLSDEQARLANSKLILLLCNHIGDDEVLREAIAVAREGLGTAPAA